MDTRERRACRIPSKPTRIETRLPLHLFVLLLKPVEYLPNQQGLKLFCEDVNDLISKTCRIPSKPTRIETQGRGNGPQASQDPVEYLPNQQGLKL